MKILLYDRSGSSYTEEDDIIRIDGTVHEDRIGFFKISINNFIIPLFKKQSSLYQWHNRTRWFLLDAESLLDKGNKCMRF